MKAKSTETKTSAKPIFSTRRQQIASRFLFNSHAKINGALVSVSGLSLATKMCDGQMIVYLLLHMVAWLSDLALDWCCRTCTHIEIRYIKKGQEHQSIPMCHSIETHRTGNNLSPTLRCPSKVDNKCLLRISDSLQVEVRHMKVCGVLNVRWRYSSETRGEQDKVRVYCLSTIRVRMIV